MNGRERSIEVDVTRCIGCVACMKSCPTKALRVRGGVASPSAERCIDCGNCVRACRREAARAVTSAPDERGRFRATVAIPSMALFGQFGAEAEPSRVLGALVAAGFDAIYDLSWMCAMLARATDAHLARNEGPWPKISTDCPAIVRLVQLRYPDLVSHLMPFESARELAARAARAEVAAARGLDPKEVGVFFVTPCAAIVNSIREPEGLDHSFLDGAYSIAELYGRMLAALKHDAPRTLAAERPVSAQGLRWAYAGGAIAGMRSVDSIAVRGVAEVEHAFERIEAGRIQGVDYIEAHICPDGCVSGPLTVEGRYNARHHVEQLADKLGGDWSIDEQEVRALVREHFFDTATALQPRRRPEIAADLRGKAKLMREKAALLERLPQKDCGACGAPDCQTLVDDVLRCEADLADCVFLKLHSLEARLRPRGEGNG